MNDLWRRLAEQVGDEALARKLLIQRGHMTPEGELTAAGMDRQNLGVEGRAKARASQRDGKPASDHHYNPATNRATLHLKPAAKLKSARKL